MSMSKKDKSGGAGPRHAGKETEEENIVVEEEVIEHADCVKCPEYLAGWKRALADYDNLKKDLGRERDEMRQYIKMGLAEELLMVLDNFDQAVKYKPAELTKEVENWVAGVCHVQNQFDEVLRGLGLEPFGDVGKTFDANCHDAAAERTEDDKEDQEILEVQTRGWRMGDRVVRPAKVIVNNIS
ncbi:MAG: nucleotide exchange factor GrpE [Parcubacteria group bacterium]|nr:nucleotide exchange factor GrpE [Parcubacteria group bacterium]